MVRDRGGAMMWSRINGMPEAERRTWRVWFADGLPDFIAGGTELVAGLLFLAPLPFPMAMVGLILIGNLAARRILPAAKRRFTDRTAGYVRPLEAWREHGYGRRIQAVGIIAAVVGGLSSVADTAFPNRPALLPYLIYILVTGGAVQQVRQTGLTRYAWLAIVAVLAAIVAPPGEPVDRYAWGVLFGAIGAAHLAVAAYTRWSYLRTPLEPPTA